MVCAPVRRDNPRAKSRGLSLRTGSQTMLYLTCTTISSVDLAQYGISLAKVWVSVECGTRTIIVRNKPIALEYRETKFIGIHPQRFQLFQGICKVSQKVVPLHTDFMTLLCTYQCDIGYFLARYISFSGLLHNRIMLPIYMKYVFKNYPAIA